jgi:hypothetical protein
LKRSALVLFVVSVFAVGAAVAILTISTPRTQHTETNTATTTTNLSRGLEFTMVLNSSTVKWGHDLGVSVNLVNALDRTNNVTGAKDWRLTDKSESGPSMNCAQNDPFRFEVVKGYYDLNNFSRGTPLNITVFQPPLGANQCLR